MNPEPFRECPRFLACSVNSCPLDPNQESRPNLSEEPRCPLGKTYRRRIAARYPELLPNRGLRPLELSSLLRWEGMTDAEREAVRARLEQTRSCFLPALRNEGPGPGIDTPETSTQGAEVNAPEEAS